MIERATKEYGIEAARELASFPANLVHTMKEAATRNLIMMLPCSTHEALLHQDSQCPDDHSCDLRDFNTWPLLNTYDSTWFN